MPLPGFRLQGSVTVIAGANKLGRVIEMLGAAELFHGWHGGQRLLGMRAQIITVEGLHGQTVPLTYMASMGGTLTMRGFSAGRFRGESVAWLTTEYWAALRRARLAPPGHHRLAGLDAAAPRHGLPRAGALARQGEAGHPGDLPPDPVAGPAEAAQKAEARPAPGPDGYRIVELRRPDLSRQWLRVHVRPDGRLAGIER